MTAAIPLAIQASKGAQHTLSEALTADLAVIRWEGKKRRKSKKNTQYEVHVNPAAIGLGALGIAGALFILDENVRRSTATGVTTTWWDVAKVGSPLGYLLDKLFSR